MYQKLVEQYSEKELRELRDRIIVLLTKEGGNDMFTITLHKHYKTLAHMIIEKAKREKRMARWDYEHIVRPFATILRTKRLSEKELLAGFKRSRVAIVK